MLSKDRTNQESFDAARPRILIADDDAISRTLIRGSLGADFELVEARDGQQAIDTLNESNDFVCVITDDRMPHKSGFEVAEHVRDSASHKHIPVLLITASETNTIARQVESTRAGASAFLNKPFTRAQLQRLVGLLVSNASRRAGGRPLTPPPAPHRSAHENRLA